jgi:hypothetical protein
LKNLGPGGIDDVTVRMRSLEKTLLVGKPAYHFVAEYESKDNDYTEEHIVSVANRPDIDYSIMLKTPSSRFPALSPVFQKIVGSWQWIPKDWEKDWKKKQAEKN